MATITREETATINAAWLGQIYHTLLYMMQTEADGAKRMRYGTVFADVCYYHAQMQREAEELRTRKEKRQRQRQMRRQQG